MTRGALTFFMRLGLISNEMVMPREVTLFSLAAHATNLDYVGGEQEKQQDVE